MGKLDRVKEKDRKRWKVVCRSKQISSIGERRIERHLRQIEIHRATGRRERDSTVNYKENGKRKSEGEKERAFLSSHQNFPHTFSSW